MKIKNITEGEKISEPGLYRIPMHWYHGDCCIGPSVSSSGLKLMDMDCPAAFRWTNYLFPDAFPRDDKPALAFGRAAHALLIGGEDFEAHYAVSEFDSFRSKDARAWRDDMIEQGKTVITQGDLTKIHNMAKILRMSPVAETLLEGEIELSMVWQDAETGIWLKARPDMLNLSGIDADFKTTRSAKPRDCYRAITDYGYDLQRALVHEAFEAILDRPVSMSVLVFQDTNAPHLVTPIELSPESISIARLRNRKALRLLADCFEKDEWPDYDTGALSYDTPDWLRERVEASTAEAA